MRYGQLPNRSTSRPPQYPRRVAYAAQPAALWRSGKNPWADDRMAQRHDLTAAILIDDEFDAEECRRALQAYCREVALVPNPYARAGLAKRLLQLRSLASTRSFERLRVTAPAFQEELDRILRARRFDVVNLEFSFLGHCDLRQAPPGERPPALVVNWHHPRLRSGSAVRSRWRRHRSSRLCRHQLAQLEERGAGGLSRRRRGLPLQRGGRAASRRRGGSRSLHSGYSQRRGCRVLPAARERIRRRMAAPWFSSEPSPIFPNVDGVIHFVKEIWPGYRCCAVRCALEDHRLQAQSLTQLAGPQIELTGFAPDLRPHLAAASVVVVPLRLGGGTRLKIVEAMAMGKAIVSTSLGAEGSKRPPGKTSSLKTSRKPSLTQ